MDNHKHSRLNRLALFSVIIVYLLAILVFFYNYQSIADWIRLRGYNPPTNISLLVQEDTMRPYTTHLFYLNKPSLLPTVSSFRQNCPQNMNIVVLGCYHPKQNGIFIYDVQNPSLNGINQVTAAHEVLHAVYERLNPTEKNQLNKDLQNFYDHALKDDTVRNEIKLYIKTEPDSIYDEMSCTFGTEVKDLSPALNNYYNKYFTDRMKIFSYYQAYESQFSSRLNQIYAYNDQLSVLNNKLEADRTQLNSMRSQLTAQKSTMDSLMNTNPSAYNQMVTPYNDLVNRYNDLRQVIIGLTDQYNSVVESRNKIVIQLQALDSAINTKTLTN